MGSTNETLALSYALALHSGVRIALATCRQGRRKAARKPLTAVSWGDRTRRPDSLLP